MDIDAIAVIAMIIGVPMIVAGAILAKKLESRALSRLCMAAMVLGILMAASGLLYLVMKFGLLWAFDWVTNLSGSE